MATYYDAINDGETSLSNPLDIAETTSFLVNDGSQLPVGGTGTSGFIIKLEDTLGNREYIECSHRNGNTVYISSRGIENTSARSWVAGSYLKNVFTKGTKDNISDKIGDLLYTEDNYIVDSEPLTDSVDKIDMTLKDTNDTLSSHMAESANKHITESGNSSNGSYIKFDDGTMICAIKRGQYITDSPLRNFFISSVITWVYPVTFVEIFSVSANASYNNKATQFAVISDGSITDTQLTSYLISDSVDASGHINFMAFGRWK